MITPTEIKVLQRYGLIKEYQAHEPVFANLAKDVYDKVRTLLNQTPGNQSNVRLPTEKDCAKVLADELALSLLWKNVMTRRASHLSGSSKRAMREIMARYIVHQQWISIVIRNP